MHQTDWLKEGAVHADMNQRLPTMTYGKVPQRPGGKTVPEQAEHLCWLKGKFMKQRGVFTVGEILIYVLPFEAEKL